MRFAPGGNQYGATRTGRGGMNTADVTPEDRKFSTTLGTVRAGVKLTPEILDGIWLTLLLALIGSSGRIVIPITIQYSLDHGLSSGADQAQTISVLTWSVIIGLLALIAAGFSSAFMNIRLVTASEKALAHLRIMTFEHILKLAPSRFEKEQKGALVSRVTSDIDRVTDFTQSGGVTLAMNFAQVIVATIIMACYSLPLTLVVLAVTLPMLPLMQRAQKIIARKYAAVRIKVGSLYTGISETVLGAEIIRSFGITDRMQHKVDRLVDDAAASEKTTLWPLGINMSIGETINGLITSAVVVTGALFGANLLQGTPFEVLVSGFTMGELVAFLFLITFFVRPLQFSVTLLGESQSAMAGWRRVLAIMDLPVDEVTEADGKPLPAGAIRVELNEVEFSYVPEKKALHCLNLEIPAGSQVAVVGETGSGKSTFAKLLTRQLKPTSGTITVNGVDLNDVSSSQLARRVAIVPQDAFLFDTTIRENIKRGKSDATEEEINSVLQQLGLTPWIESLPRGLDTRVGQRGDSLSAGERQLVALARTALVDPDLLVLDEATSGVDPALDVQVQKALTKLAKDRTTVTIAHRMITAETADRILLFDNGVLHESGTHDELVAHGGEYARLYAAWGAMKAL